MYGSGFINNSVIWRIHFICWKTTENVGVLNQNYIHVKILWNYQYS